MNYYFNSIIEITLPITAFISLMLLLSPFIKKTLVVKWRYFVWLFIGLRLIFPFKVRLFRPIKIALSENISKDFRVFSDVDIIEKAVNTSISISDILFYVWIIGAVLYFTINMFFYIRIKKNIKRWNNIPSDKTLEMIGEFGICKERIKVCKFTTSPMVFGIFKPVIILPHENYSEKELRMILHHETVHYKNHDVFYKFVLTLAMCLHWFNPVIHKMYKTAVRDLEFCCDNEVVAEQDADFCAEYCHVLVSAIRHSKHIFVPCSTSLELRKKVLGERISAVFDKKTKRKGSFLLGVAFDFVLVCGGLVEYTSAKIIENTPVQEAVEEIKRPEKTNKPVPVEEPAITELPVENELPVESEVSVKSEDVKEQIPVQTSTKEAEEAFKTEEFVQEVKTEKVTEPDNIIMSSYSVEDTSLNITVLPEMDGQIIPFEFTGNKETNLRVGCIEGTCGYQIINMTTGDVAADNSDGKKTNISAVFDGENTYCIRVFADDTDTASIYVYSG